MAVKDHPQSHRLTKESSRQVGCVAISDDNQVIAAAETVDFKNKMPRRNELDLAKGFGVKVWNLADGNELLSFVAHGLPINLVAISRDHSLLATASTDESIEIWDLEKPGEPIATFYGQAPFTALMFDSDGKHLLAGDEKGRLRIWELASAATTIELEGEGRIGEVCFIDGGKRIVGGSNVWDIKTGKRVAELAFAPGQGRDNRRIAITADERFASGGLNLIGLEDFANAPCHLNTNWPLDVAFHPRGTQLATAETSREIFLAELPTGKEIRRLKFPKDTEQVTSWATSVAFSPDGETIIGATGGTSPHQPGKIALWNLETGACLREFTGHGKSVWRVVFDRDGSRIAAATGNYLLTDVDNGVLVWDAATGACLHVLQGHRECVYDVEFSPDGAQLASVSGLFQYRSPASDSPGELKLWDLQTGQELLTIEHPSAGLVSVAFDETGTQIAVGATNGTTTVFRPNFSP
jgi:WD40 repeat protein